MVRSNSFVIFARIICCFTLLSTSSALAIADKKEGEGKAPETKSPEAKAPDVKAADSKPNDYKPVVAPRRAGSKNASGVLDLSFDDFKFDIEKGAKFDRSLLPTKIEDLKGKKFTISGYIHPSSLYQREGIKTFILVRDDKECCFGPQAAIYDCMRIELVGDASTSFTTRPIKVEGELDIKEWGVIDGVPMAIFHVKAKSAK